jgi:hypothetical protein
VQARSSGDDARVQRSQRPRVVGAVRGALVAGLLAAVAVQLAPAREAAAAPPGDVPASPAPPVTSCGGSGPDALEVTLARMPREPALRHAVCDWFRDEPWRVTFHSQEAALPRADVPASGQLLVTIFPLSADAAQLNITAPGRSPDWRPARWLERVPLRSGFDDVGIEVIAQSLHSTAQATLSRALVPPPAPPAPPNPPAPSALPTSALPTSALPATASLAAEEPVLRAERSASGELDAPARVHYGLPLPVHTALGYHFHARGSEPVTHGPSLRIELDWLSRDVIFSSYVRTALFTSPRARAEGVELGLNGIGLGAGLAASVPSGRWTGRFALGSSVDLLGLDVGVVDDSETRSLGGGRPKPRFFMTSEAGLSRRFARVEVGLSALLRWQTSASYYEVLDEGETRTILRASRFQPGAALEIAYVW